MRKGEERIAMQYASRSYLASSLC